jgi:hypothetical protein
MQGIPHFIAWIDYLIASEDPADQALATEFRTQDWAMRELVEAIASDMRMGEATTGWLEKMEAQRRICDELTKRVFDRAQALVAEGALPADEAAVASDWRARAVGPHLIARRNDDAEIRLPPVRH